MRTSTRWLLAALVIVAIALAFLLLEQSPEVVPPPPPAAPLATEPAPVQAVPATPNVRFPVAEQPAEAPSLPALDQSDTSMRAGLAPLVGSQNFNDWFIPKELIRRIVATIDNLPRQSAARRLMPVRSMSGLMAVTGSGAEPAISPENFARYLPFVALAESVDSSKVVALYLRHYPLFQQAYRELGFPQGYFNDRLIEVIDHLLLTPEVKEPILLVQKKVLYQFADPDLESLSAGQKIMIRIGKANATRLKAKLREIRGQVVGNPD